MKDICIAIIAISISIMAFPQDMTGIFKFDASRDGHIATISFTVREFNPKEHKISGLSLSDRNAFRIDGRVPIGVDCSIPKYHIQSIDLVFDGRSIRIPKELYSDCYEPAFAWPMSHKSISNAFAVKIADDLKGVFAFMSGSDGAGHYDVIWVLRSDGKHSRITNTVSDCGMIDCACASSEP
jgi:hypothetical protein